MKNRNNEATINCNVLKTDTPSMTSTTHNYPNDELKK